MIEKKTRYKVGECGRYEYWYDPQNKYVWQLLKGRTVFYAWLCSVGPWDRTFRHGKRMSNTFSTDELERCEKREVEQPVYIPGKNPPWPAGRFVGSKETEHGVKLG